MISVTNLRVSRGSCSGATSPVRQASTHGRCHERGAPPATMVAKSRSSRGSLPGASAKTASPSSSTSGAFGAAHSMSARCADSSPFMLDRQTSRTRGGIPAFSNAGQVCCVERDPSIKRVTVLSPAPPCTPTTHNVAEPDTYRRGSRSVASGSGIPFCGVEAPVRGGTIAAGAGMTSGLLDVGCIEAIQGLLTNITLSRICELSEYLR